MQRQADQALALAQQQRQLEAHIAVAEAEAAAAHAQRVAAAAEAAAEAAALRKGYEARLVEQQLRLLEEVAERQGRVVAMQMAVRQLDAQQQQVRGAGKVQPAAFLRARHAMASVRRFPCAC